MNHGNQCESVILSSPLYNYEITNDEAVCKDPAGSCGRAICECDAKFAREHVGHIGVFDEKYQIYGANGEFLWSPVSDDATCSPGGGGGVYDPECCTHEDGTGPALLFNAASKACCSDGRVVIDASKC